MHQSVISISRCRVYAHRIHNSNKYGRSNCPGNGAEGGQQRGRVRHLLGLHIAGAPCQQRHHQTADGNVADHIETGGDPERRTHGQKIHTDVADNQNGSAGNKDLFDSHFVIYRGLQQQNQSLETRLLRPP